MVTQDEPDDPLPQEREILKTKRCSYEVVRLIGKGGYGAVFEIIRKSDGEHLAIKCEKMTNRRTVLTMEKKVLSGARQINSLHFCTIQDRGTLQDRFKFVIMQLVGRNLWDLRISTEELRFNIGTSLKAATQCLICIEQIHRIGFLHRDIKPGNFAVGRQGQKDLHTIYMLDFGLCRKFSVVKDKDVRMPRDIVPFRGTTRYAPLAAMKHIDQSRKDDLEGWLYMVVEWTCGRLPWSQYKTDNRDEVLKKKEELRTDPKALDKFLSRCPKREFIKILKYLDELTYFCIPDYKFIFDVILHAMKTNKVRYADPVDWDPNNAYTAPFEQPGEGKPDLWSVDRKKEQKTQEEV
ncbi:unnamed protein product [Auanema sp. JU1783]|nr:unnamed protein product [Auanema sp. JU1783]